MTDTNAPAAPHVYDAEGTPCHGYLALPEGDGPVAGVLVTPAFLGLTDLERGICDRLAAMGYAALGVDYYGEGRTAEGREQAMEMMGAMNRDRPLLLGRMEAALSALKAVERVEADRCGAIGYCFGGKAVLDLARGGAEFRAGVSFHGVYDAPPSGSRRMAPSLLICHGWDDPLCPPEATVGLARELTEHCADWQLLAFGHTGHGFTNPKANDPSHGLAHSASASDRAWAAMERLFAERLA